MVCENSQKDKMVVPLIAGALIGLRLALPKIISKVAPRIISIGKSLIPKTVKGKIGAIITVPTVIGILGSSPKARDVVKKTLDPRESVRRGKRIAEIIEDPSRARDVLGIKETSTFKEKLITGAKVGGIVGLGVAGIVGAKTLLERRKEKKLIQEQEEAQRLVGLKQVGFTEPLPVGLGGVPVAIQPQIQPAGRPGEPLTKPPVSNIIQIQVH